jgi:capsular polysaccharide biosynthesis protein
MLRTEAQANILRLVSETAVSHLQAVTLLDGFECKTSSLSNNWSGAAAGVKPRWWSPDLTIMGDPLIAYSLQSAFYVPSMGAVITDYGEVLSQTVRHASYVDPKMERLQEIWIQRSSAPELSSGIITMSWGAVHNYGHFLLDALTSAAALAENSAFRDNSFVVPPLRAWQRQHFDLLGITPTELSEPIYSIRRATFTSGIKGALHNPNMYFHVLRDAQTSRARLDQDHPLKIYISRQGQKRPFLSEPQLETALIERGFCIVRPETIPVSEQIAHFRSADVIVAPTGAALANWLYAKSGVRLVEIIPRDMTLSDTAHKWVAYLVAMAGGDWRPYFCENVGHQQRPEIGGQQRAGFLPFDLAIDELMAFINQG